MRISKEMTIAGVPAVELRDTFKWLGGSHWSGVDLAERLGVAGSTGQQIATKLLEEGYCEIGMQHQGVSYFNLTMKGAALSLASAAKPIKRATADRLVSQVIQAANDVNSNPNYFYRVTKLLAFGSYLSDSQTLGDVDLAVELTPRVGGKTCDSDAILEYAARAAKSGKRFGNFMDKLIWPTEEIFGKLKGTSKAISLHPSTDDVLKTADTRVLYEYP